MYSEEEQSIVEAVTYYATNIKEGLSPYHWYKSFVLEGAIENRLPEEYIDLIRHVESIDDLDVQRARLNETVLARILG